MYSLWAVYNKFIICPKIKSFSTFLWGWKKCPVRNGQPMSCAQHTFFNPPHPNLKFQNWNFRIFSPYHMSIAVWTWIFTKGSEWTDFLTFLKFKNAHFTFCPVRNTTLTQNYPTKSFFIKINLFTIDKGHVVLHFDDAQHVIFTTDLPQRMKNTSECPVRNKTNTVECPYTEMLHSGYWMKNSLS